MVKRNPNEYKERFKGRVQALMITVELDSGKIAHACADVSPPRESSKLRFDIMLL